MLPSVLQPVDSRRRRRRRRRGLRALLLVLVVAVFAAGAVAAADDGLRNRALFRSSSASRSTAPRPAPAVHHAARPLQRSAPRRLLSAMPAGPLHFFRPPLRASAAILVDAATGEVLYARRPHQRRPIASTTKIMTAVLALERLRPTQRIRIAGYVARTAPIREGLRRGERVPAWKLLYGLMLFSGNDDAVALAAAAGGSKQRFIGLMNAKARLLGLRDTQFTTPSGVVDRGNRSTAWDLAALTRYAMRIPRFRTVVRTRIARVRWAAPTYGKVYVNKNQLIGRYRGADGVKTGWTTVAGHCLVASAHRGRVRLIAVVLHSPDPYRDARRLLNFGFAQSS